MEGSRILQYRSTGPKHLAGQWLALAETEPYQRALAIWCGVFLTGFFVLPGGWPQHVLFYGGLLLALPGVVAMARPLCASPLARVLAAFLAYSAFSALWSDRWLTVGDQSRKALCIGCFLAICCAVGRDGPQRWRKVLCGVQVVAAVAATLFAADFLWYCRDCARFVGYGRFANPNYTGSVTGAVALLGLTAVLSARGRRTLPLLMCQLPILYLLLLTGSRAALLAYLGGVGLSVVLIVLRGRAMPASAARARRAILTAVGCVMLIGAGTASLGQAWLSAEIERGDTHRMEIWAANLSWIAQRPWFGYGSTTPDPFAENGVVLGYHAHNLFLAQAFYGGVAGLLLWVSVFALAGRVAFKAWRESGDVLPLGCLWFLLAVGMVDIGPVTVEIQAIWLYVWAILGIVLSYDVASRARQLRDDANLPPCVGPGEFSDGSCRAVSKPMAAAPGGAIASATKSIPSVLPPKSALISGIRKPLKT